MTFSSYTEDSVMPSAASAKRWRESHPELMKAYRERFRKANPDYWREWKAANPKKMKQYAAARRKLAAKQRQTPTAG